MSHDQAEADEISRLRSDLEAARATNASFHRRVQRLEGPLVSKLDKAKIALRYARAHSGQSFDRVLNILAEMQRVYDQLQRVYGKRVTIGFGDNVGGHPRTEVWARVYRKVEGGEMVEYERPVAMLTELVDAYLAMVAGDKAA